MHVAFVDIVYGYAADRPDTDEPLGGTTSAICFLARELVKSGVKCTFYNKIGAVQTVHGIPAKPLNALVDDAAGGDITAYIFCGRWMEVMVRLLRGLTSAPFIAWMHESAFNPQWVPALDAFDAIAFVSEWQQRINQDRVLPKWKQTVLRNAMNPLAANIFAESESIISAKTKPPVLLYAGGAARGVFHLPPILEELRKTQQDFSVEIFCNTNPSRDPEKDAQYIDWLRNLPNVSHVGMVGQPQLIDHMKRASFFVAPNPWPETSCIALIEAMAAGLSVITTNRAALPETASGFAQHVTIAEADDPIRFDMPIDPAVFAAAISAAMDEQRLQPEQAEQKLRKQISFTNQHYQWSQRVKPWIDFVKSLTVSS
jgi:glycosyltransferase involved in cell wall biosynthesis